ncbi:MAG: adenylyl-sulfate kinase [Opitutaceae bacterium]|jgi:bifunctional enzyme CysN/CysC|nr:adenylyl-sulfate kinase [Opitutaceae bacterium]
MPELDGGAARRELLGHRGAVVWLTGLPGAGKSTLARGLERGLLASRVLPAVVDGDELRRGLSERLGFSPEDRRENIRRAAALALALAEAGLVAIVALISPYAADRDEAARRFRARGIPFDEVYVNAPREVCEQRDPKGLYREARAGRLEGLTGLDSPYEPPPHPALELRTGDEDEQACVQRLREIALRIALSG